MEPIELRPKSLPPDVEKEVTRQLLVQPKDEVPDPNNPEKIMWLDGIHNGQIKRREPDLRPPSQRIQCTLDMKPLMTAVNEAVVNHDMEGVIRAWKSATFKVEKISDFLVRVTVG